MKLVKLVTAKDERMQKLFLKNERNIKDEQSRQ
jgi:hypothetical protein